MLRPLLAVVRVTSREVVRQPIFVIIFTAGLAAQGLVPAVTLFGFGQNAALCRELGLSTAFLGGVAILLLGAVTVFAREVESGQAATVVSKPLSAGGFLAGKFLGLLKVLGASLYPWILALLLAARQGPSQSKTDPWDGPVLVGGLGGVALGFLWALISSLRGKGSLGSKLLWSQAFGLSLGILPAVFLDAGWQVQRPGTGLDPRILEAALLLSGGLVTLTASTLLFLTMAPRLPLLALGGAFFGGLALGAWDSPAAALFPALPGYWASEIFYAGAGLPLTYLLMAALHAASYSLVCLLIGKWIWSRREIG
jgi:hypothetical protein